MTPSSPRTPFGSRRPCFEVTKESARVGGGRSPHDSAALARTIWRCAGHPGDVLESGTFLAADLFDLARLLEAHCHYRGGLRGGHCYLREDVAQDLYGDCHVDDQQR